MPYLVPRLESTDWPATEAILECYVATGAWLAARAVFDNLERLRAAGQLGITRDEEVDWRLLEAEAALQADFADEAYASPLPVQGGDAADGLAVLIDTLNKRRKGLL